MYMALLPLTSRNSAGGRGVGVAPPAGPAVSSLHTQGGAPGAPSLPAPHPPQRQHPAHTCVQGSVPTLGSHPSVPKACSLSFLLAAHRSSTSSRGRAHLLAGGPWSWASCTRRGWGWHRGAWQGGGRAPFWAPSVPRSWPHLST